MVESAAARVAAPARPGVLPVLRLAEEDRASVLAGGVLALALLGDALLYLVLPVEAAAFGVGGAWIGILLSANRFVRLGVNVLLVPLARRRGLGGLAVVGAVLGAVSTAGYAVLTGGAALLSMRLVWGTAYSALRLAQLGLATDVGAGSGRRLGWSVALAQLGPLFAVTGGALMARAWGLQPSFAVLGGLSAVGVVLARRLPRHTAPAPGARPARQLLPVPVRTDVTAFLFTLATDGLFMVALTPLLVREGFTAAAAIQAGGAVLVVRRLGAVVIGPAAGRLADRLGLVRLFRFSLALVALGFGAVACGTGLAGLVALGIAVPVLQLLAPGVAALRAGDRRLHRLASHATWSDLGAAVGALAAGTLLGAADVRLFFAGAGVLTLAALAVEHARPPALTAATRSSAGSAPRSRSAS